MTPRAVKWAYRLFLDRRADSAATCRDLAKALPTTPELRRHFLDSSEYRASNGSARRDAVTWAYRLMLGREPENQAVVDNLAAATSTIDQIRREIISSEEYQRQAGVALPPAELRGRVFAPIPLGGRVLVDLRDVAIGLSIAQGNFEPEETEWVLRHLEPGDHVADVGANIGFFTVLAAKRVGSGGRVTAFEPAPAVQELLRASIAESRVEAQVELIPKAVSDTRGTVRLVFQGLDQGSRNSGGSYLAPAGTDAASTVVAETVPLDEVPFERLDLLKVDAEGAEPLVFRGARATLERHRPAILFELNPLQLRRVAQCSAADVHDLLTGLGYEVRLLSGAPLTGLDDAAVLSAVALPRRP